jgi:hypothetical protein
MATNNYNNYSINNNNSPNFLLIQLSWRTANYIAASQNPVKKYMESLYNIIILLLQKTDAEQKSYYFCTKSMSSLLYKSSHTHTSPPDMNSEKFLTFSHIKPTTTLLNHLSLITPKTITSRKSLIIHTSNPPSTSKL